MVDTPEQNKAIMRRMLEAYNTGNTDIVEELLDPNIQETSRALGFEAELRGADTIRRVQTEILRQEDAFPDRHFTEEMMVAQGDHVVLRWQMTGTNLGPILGRPPTGKRVTTHGTETVRIRNGKIIEHRGDEGTHVFDVLNQVDLLDTAMVRMLNAGDRELGADHRTAPRR